MLSIRALVTVVLLSALATGQAAAQGRLWTVDSRGGADFTVLQSAILAAADGDVVAVRGGPYTPIAVVGRQLTVVADQGFVRVDGPCRLTNTPEGGTLTLVGPLVFSEQLRVFNSAGTIWLEVTYRIANCEMLNRDVSSISLAAGGAQIFTLAAGASEAGKIHWLVGSQTGTSPGIPVPGVGVLPLNDDPYFQYSIANPNGPMGFREPSRLPQEGSASTR